MGDKDGRGLKLEKLACKNHQKNLWFVGFEWKVRTDWLIVTCIALVYGEK